MRFVRITVMLACSLALSAVAQQSDPLNFASGLEQFHDIHSILPNYVKGIGFQMIAERKSKVEHLSTLDDLKKRGDLLRERMMADLGGFPEKTPLNARVVGVVERPKYRIEKIIFESQPHFYVTANLYLPGPGTLLILRSYFLWDMNAAARQIPPGSRPWDRLPLKAS